MFLCCKRVTKPCVFAAVSAQVIQSAPHRWQHESSGEQNRSQGQRVLAREEHIQGAAVRVGCSRVCLRLCVRLCVCVFVFVWKCVSSRRLVSAPDLLLVALVCSPCSVLWLQFLGLMAAVAALQTGSAWLHSTSLEEVKLGGVAMDYVRVARCVCWHTRVALTCRMWCRGCRPVNGGTS